LLVVFSGPSLLNAQQEPGSQRQERRAGVQEPTRTAKATRVEHAPRLDGTLDDPAWQMASPITKFLQREPFEGQPPRIRGTYRANERLSFSLAEQWNRFRLGIVSDSNGNLLPPSSANFSVVFGSFQTNYSFSRFLTLSALLQMDTANTQAASANIRLRWNYRPDSDLFFIYTAGQRFASLVAANPPQYYENRFAIKFTYSWRP